VLKTFIANKTINMERPMIQRIDLDELTVGEIEFLMTLGKYTIQKLVKINFINKN
jgi:hypothetical protein